MTSTTKYQVRERQLQLDMLEAIVDRIDLSGVLELLAEIAHSKAQHLRENWQDEAHASYFEAAGRYLDLASTRRAIVDTSPVR